MRKTIQRGGGMGRLAGTDDDLNRLDVGSAREPVRRPAQQRRTRERTILLGNAAARALAAAGGHY
jgi:hypothetical protein